MIRPSQCPARPGIEALDARALPSGGLSASLSGGVLSLSGTPGADVIRVAVRPEGPRGREFIEVAGIPRRIPAARVRLVVVAGGGGDDALILDDLAPGSCRPGSTAARAMT